MKCNIAVKPDGTKVYVANQVSNTVSVITTASNTVTNTIAVGEESYTADHIVIATGGQPIVPPIPGAEHGITSDGFFELMEQPGKVAVIGGGYIGVELSGVLRALGSEVTTVALENRVLELFDPMISEVLMREMTKQGMQLRMCFQVAGLARTESGIALDASDGERLDGFDCVIWAVGRTANTGDLGLETLSDYLEQQAASGQVDAVANMADDAVRYHAADLSLADMQGMRHLYYRRTFLRMAAALDDEVRDRGLEQRQVGLRLHAAADRRSADMPRGPGPATILPLCAWNSGPPGGNLRHAPARFQVGRRRSDNISRPGAGSRAPATGPSAIGSSRKRAGRRSDSGATSPRNAKR